MHVDLGKGQTAEILDVEDMPHLVRKTVQAMQPVPQPDGSADYSKYTPVLIIAMRDALISHVVTEWTLDKPLPAGSPAALEALPSHAYDALITATEPHWEHLGFTSPKKTAPRDDSGS